MSGWNARMLPRPEDAIGPRPGQFLAFQPLVKDWAEVVPEPWDNRVEEPFRAEAVSYLPAPIFNKLKQF